MRRRTRKNTSKIHRPKQDKEVVESESYGNKLETQEIVVNHGMLMIETMEELL